MYTAIKFNASCKYRRLAPQSCTMWPTVRACHHDVYSCEQHDTLPSRIVKSDGTQTVCCCNERCISRTQPAALATIAFQSTRLWHLFWGVSWYGILGIIGVLYRSRWRCYVRVREYERDLTKDTHSISFQKSRVHAFQIIMWSTKYYYFSSMKSLSLRCRPKSTREVSWLASLTTTLCPGRGMWTARYCASGLPMLWR